MEKKEYIKPEIEVVELEIESPILSVSDGKVDIFDEETDQDANMSNKRRGQWGDLWE